MKVVVFAHTPPPHHGQSYMVELMLRGFGGDARMSPPPKKEYDVQCYHVNARISDGINDIGRMRPGKLLRFFGYCLEAVWCRVRYGADTLYYVPAPAKKSAILRDWLVMAFVRPWFACTIFHWHAFGLGHWATGKSEKPFEGELRHQPVIFGRFECLARCVTRALFSKVDLSIVLTEYNRSDAELFFPRRISVVPNCIPDPCPDFSNVVLPQRLQRQAERVGAGATLQILYLAHCIREKGIFDTLEAVSKTHHQLQKNEERQTVRLTVAGEFMTNPERKQFFRRLDEVCAQGVDVVYVGFLDAEAKDEALRTHDVLCFPTFYTGETFGVTLLEAMAYGLPFITSRFRGLGEVAPHGWPHLVGVHDCDAITECFLELCAWSDYDKLRQYFLQNYEFTEAFPQLYEALKVCDSPSAS